MAAPFRQRVRLSVYGTRAILRCRGTVPASIGRWLAVGPLQSANHRGLSPGTARAAPLPVSGAGFTLAVPTPPVTEAIPAEALPA